MNLRSASSILLFVLTLPATAWADRHRADVFAGYFHAQGSKYDGWQLSGSWPIEHLGLSLVGSFGRYWGTEDADDNRHILVPYLIGLRWTAHKLGSKEVLPFFQIIAGGVDNVRKIGDGLSEVHTHPVGAVGFGVQPPWPFGGKSGEERRIRVRLQADLFYRCPKDFLVKGAEKETGGVGLAVSVGFVYQFGAVK